VSAPQREQRSRQSATPLLGLGSLWTPAVVATVLAAEVVGGIVDLSLRRKTVTA
jgi:hypothetical protein